MSDKQFQPGEQHPDEWQQDLNPNAHAGQNDGHMSDYTATEAPTAHDIKEVHRQFSGSPMPS